MSGSPLDAVPAGQRAALRAADHPRRIEPQLARPTDRPPDGGGWLHERKFDGIRLHVHLEGTQVRLLTRAGNDRRDRYPTIVAALGELATDLAGDAVLDAELVATIDGRESLGAVLRRPSAVPGGATPQLHLHVFDVLHLDGTDLRGLALRDRRRVLGALPTHTAVTPVEAGTGPVTLAAACEAGWEGLMFKRLDAPYRSGRSDAWRKLACRQEGAFVVGGWTVGRGGSALPGALLLGRHTPEGLRYAGKVGTGLSDEIWTIAGRHLRGIEEPAPPFLDAPGDPTQRWATPHLVVVVGFHGWTEAGRLRHPRLLALRPDLPAAVATGDPPRSATS